VVSDNVTLDENLGAAPKRLRANYKWVRGFFYLTAVGFIIMIIGCVVVFFTDYAGYNPDQDFLPPDIFIGIGGIIYLIGFLGGIISFSMFTYRAMKNLHIWNNRYAEMSPGWTVGWYFIPFANLWKPYQAMEQIWTGTHHEMTGNYDANSKIGVWWGCWVLFNLTSGIGNALSGMDGPWNTVMRQSAIADIAALSLGILAIVIIVPVLKKIMELQNGRTNSMVFG